MLRYLDNADNAAGHLNENYAREIMELHTMGVGSGYTQSDVEALARILTGVGIDTEAGRPQAQAGTAIAAGARGRVRIQSGAARLRRQDFPRPHHQGTRARRSRRGDRHPRAAIRRPPRIFRKRSRPILSRTIRLLRWCSGWRKPSRKPTAISPRCLPTMVHAPEFTASLKPGAKFKDPVQYVFSAVRLAYDDKVILNTQPIQNWLNRLGEGCSITRRRMAMR
jgi:hypothetical protein